MQPRSAPVVSIVSSRIRPRSWSMEIDGRTASSAIRYSACRLTTVWARPASPVSLADDVRAIVGLLFAEQRDPFGDCGCFAPGGLNRKQEHRPADLNLVAGHQLARIDERSVDERSIGTVQIAQHEFAVALREPRVGARNLGVVDANRIVNPAPEAQFGPVDIKPGALVDALDDQQLREIHGTLDGCGVTVSARGAETAQLSL
jgi:hypothetical protein